MKIAIVSKGNLPVPSIKGGAVEVLTQYIIDGFLKNGDQVDVYTKADKDLQEYHEKLKIFQFSWGKLEFLIDRCMNYIFKLLKIYIRKLPYQVKVAKEINKHDYDYILIENDILLYKIIYEKYHKKHLNTKFINHTHNTLQLENNQLRQKIYQYVCQTANKILFVSDFLKRDSSRYHTNEQNMQVLYNCIDFQVFNKENKDLSLRERLGIREDDFVYIFTGRMVDDKGIYELIKAFNLLNQEIANIKLLIIGSKTFGENSKDTFYKKIENEIVSSNIIFTGYVEPKEVVKYLNIADVVTIPSKWAEPFGVVALEAMAVGKPIIATKSGGLVEVLDDDCAIFVEKNEEIIDNLYMAMKKMYFDEGFRSNCAKNAFTKIENTKEFDKQYYFENFMKKIKE